MSVCASVHAIPQVAHTNVCGVWCTALLWHDTSAHSQPTSSMSIAVQTHAAQTQTQTQNSKFKLKSKLATQNQRQTQIRIQNPKPNIWLSVCLPASRELLAINCSSYPQLLPLPHLFLLSSSPAPTATRRVHRATPAKRTKDNSKKTINNPMQCDVHCARTVGCSMWKMQCH